MNSNHNDTIIIGTGIAGLTAAAELSARGRKVLMLEKNDSTGGHVGQWSVCFPFGISGRELAESILPQSDANVSIRTRSTASAISTLPDGSLSVSCTDGTAHSARTVLLASGYGMFDARLKEELGYGIYPGVLTSEDIERQWQKGERPLAGHSNPRFAIVHCVGSRDLKCNIRHCSKVCCMVGVKMATEIRQRYPDSQVTNYYMDLRMFDNGYEELYHDAQLNYNVQFVRGRISEVAPTNDGRLYIRAEDTLLGKPLRDKVDALVLMIGMSAHEPLHVDGEPMNRSINGFVGTASPVQINQTATPGLFVAGAAKGPMNITEVLADARAAAAETDKYLSR